MRSRFRQRSTWRYWISRGFSCLGVVFLCIALLAYKAYARDRAILHVTARSVVGKAQTPSDKVLAALDWVFHQHGFTENRAYFVVPGWRATPKQVMDGGGDCADKSRLLWAMLDELGISSTMLMCLDPNGERPVHTVVEARLGPTEYMVVDPVYNMYFPRFDGGYYGLLDLRGDSAILPARVAHLRATRGSHDPIHSYQDSRSVYSHATSIHWNKAVWTRILGNLLRKFLDDEVYRIPRPEIMEEPQLAVAWCALASVGIALTIAWKVVGPTASRQQLPLQLLAGNSRNCVPIASLR
ncbi:MAG: transglutaminase domain-containing protein [Planctomycetes bacterium]|nr:transglutaminase domain-containing protein [Planctomycetota bacterium]